MTPSARPPARLPIPPLFGACGAYFSIFRGLRRLFSIFRGLRRLFPFFGACGAYFFYFRGLRRLDNFRGLQRPTTTPNI